jgi:nucleotide-binding universal stress UspA family protein
MKRILVPIDFSEHSEDALKVAAQIAKKNNYEIYLLHMLELPGQMSDAITGGRSIPEVLLFVKKANQTFENLRERPYLEGIPVSETVLLEKASEGILNFSKKNDIDLIIMGSHGMSGLDKLHIGTNTEKVVRNSEIPVLIIKNDPGIFSAKNFVFASDFSNEVRKPFEKLLKFAEIFESKLTLVMVSTPNSFKTTALSERIMNDFVAEFDLKNCSTHIYNDTNIERGILNFSNSVNADLIGIFTHGRTGLAHFFNGSISEDLVNHTVKPVITFKI